MLDRSRLAVEKLMKNNAFSLLPAIFAFLYFLLFLLFSLFFVFSSSSSSRQARDVWSLGVVLWELMTDGEVPYGDVDQATALMWISGGKTLPQPAGCHPLIYTLMQACWHLDPSDRPSMDALTVQLHEVFFQLSQQKEETGVARMVTLRRPLSPPSPEPVLDSDCDDLASTLHGARPRARRNMRTNDRIIHETDALHNTVV